MLVKQKQHVNLVVAKWSREDDSKDVLSNQVQSMALEMTNRMF